MFYLEKEKHKVRIDKPAILVIDVQNYFFHKNSPSYLRGSERILENVVEFLRTVKSINNDIPIIATVHKGWNDNMYNWWGNVVTEQWALPFVPEELIDVLIEKSTYDAFYNTPLDELLKSKAVDQLIITGVMTHLCCETTARSGFVRGYKIVMVEDCLWDKDEWYHYASLKNIAHGFGVIASKDEVLQVLKPKE
ncbi:MAG: isochorismatase family protein [Fervidobacterium sp.]|uniref:isochorismatase family protein n=1 Tax=Fervidobacterium sp. TaxID=1871331 RepID=UPI004049011C